MDPNGAASKTNSTQALRQKFSMANALAESALLWPIVWRNSLSPAALKRDLIGQDEAAIPARKKAAARGMSAARQECEP